MWAGDDSDLGSQLVEYLVIKQPSSRLTSLSARPMIITYPAAEHHCLLASIKLNCWFGMAAVSHSHALTIQYDAMQQYQDSAVRL